MSEGFSGPAADETVVDFICSDGTDELQMHD